MPLRLRSLVRVLAGSLLLSAGAARAATGSGPAVPAFVVDGGTTVRVSGTTKLVLDCDLRNSGTFQPGAGSAVVLVGYGSPLLSDASGALSFADLTLALHGTAAIADPAGVDGTLSLSTGWLSLAGHLLVARSVAGGSPASYVVTPDTLSLLSRLAVDTGPVFFPVGHSSYDPVTVQLGTGQDGVGVAVIDSPASTGLVPATALTRAWYFREGEPGQHGDITATIQWNPGEQGAAFDRGLAPPTGAWAWRWSGAAWEPQAGVRQSDNGAWPAVNTLVTRQLGLWTLGGVGALLAVDPPPANAPRTLELSAAFPNPSRGATSLRYGLPAKTRVTLALYSVAGERVATLADGEQQAGWHLVRYEDARLPSGVYFARLQAGHEVRTSKLVLSQ